MITCDSCFKMAMNHGGDVRSVYRDGVRHWRAAILWPPTPQSKTRKPLLGTPPIFCDVEEREEARKMIWLHANTSRSVF